MVNWCGPIAWIGCRGMGLGIWKAKPGHSQSTQDSPVKLTVSPPECFQDSKIPVDDKHIKGVLRHQEGQTVGQKRHLYCKGPHLQQGPCTLPQAQARSPFPPRPPTLWSELTLSVLCCGNQEKWQPLKPLMAHPRLREDSLVMYCLVLLELCP